MSLVVNKESSISQPHEGLFVRKWVQIYSKDKGDDEFDTSHGAESKVLVVGEHLPNLILYRGRHLTKDIENFISQLLE